MQVTHHESRITTMFDDINDLYQQVILDHCKKPRNFHEMPAATCSAQGHNPLCGDNLKLFLALDGDEVELLGRGGMTHSLRVEAASGGEGIGVRVAGTRHGSGDGCNSAREHTVEV